VSRHVWSTSEVERLYELYPHYSAEVIASVLGLSKSSVLRKAKRIGLKKSTEWIAQNARENAHLPGHPAAATRFMPGLVPWNKGQKGLQIGGQHTRFRAGQRPHTWRPVGAEVIRDGALWRKVTDGDPRGSRFDYVAVHRLVWKQAHGEIPAGFVVAFRPGLHTCIAAEITLDRLELITRGEVAMRNSYHRYPPELKDAMRALKKLNNKIAEAK